MLSLIILKWFKNAQIFICVFFRFEGKIVKLKIIKFFCLVIRSAFATNWIELPVMGKFLGQKWQNHNFGDKNVSKNLFHQILVYMWSFDASSQEFNKKKFEFLGTRDFYASLKICSFWKLIPYFENRHKYHFKMTALQWKVKAYTAISFKTDLGWFFKTKKLSILHTSVFCAQI